MTGEPEPPTAEQRFDTATRRFQSDPAVTSGTGFGSMPGYRVWGKIFAMLVRGALVVKLPRARVDELVASGMGARFEPGPGRAMREWVTVPPDRAGEWDELVDEAFQFAGRGSGPSARPSR